LFGPIKQYTEITALPLHPTARKKPPINLDLEGELEWREERKLENKCTGKTQEDEQGQRI